MTQSDIGSLGKTPPVNTNNSTQTVLVTDGSESFDDISRARRLGRVTARNIIRTSLWPTAAAISVSLLAACGAGSTTRTRPTSEAPTSTVSAPSSTSISSETTVQHRSSTTKSGDSTVAKTASGHAADAHFEPNEVNPIRNTAADRVGYITNAITHLDAGWTNWFKSVGLAEPMVGYKIVMPGEIYTSNCVDGTGLNASASSTYNNTFYCDYDWNGTDMGMIVLPFDTTSKMWEGNMYGKTGGSAQGDFAAGVIIAHEFGHHVAAELATQTNSDPPVGQNAELIADCFAGVWTYAVANDGLLEDGDTNEAISALGLIGDNTGSHGTTLERQQAFVTGVTGEAAGQTFQAGDPYACIAEYWK